MSSTICIGLALSHSLAYCRGVLKGVRQYARTMPHWVLLPVAPEAAALRSLSRLHVDGLIVHAYDARQLKALAGFRGPVVNVCGVLLKSPFPRVGVDDEAAGRCAGEHLLERGLRHFAFVGHHGQNYSNRREAGFRDAVAGSAESFSAYFEPMHRRFRPMGYLWALDQKVRRWVQSLPRPIGLFTSNDIWGVQMAEVCRQLGLRVPDDVAIVGVDNDDLLCEMARPTLSSVSLPQEPVGFRAAHRLHLLLNGKPTGCEPELLPPVGVVVRQSSDVLAITDPDVAAAVRFIRDRAHLPIGVNEVLKAVTISRRSLERRFRAALELSVLDQIRRAHLEVARALLGRTDLSIAEVARKSGFTDPRRLSVVFRQEIGVTPRDFRRQARARAAF